MVTEKTIAAETFRDRDALDQAAKAIEQAVGVSNLVHRIDQDEESTFKIVFSHTHNGATPPTVIDLTLFHSGELREIRKLDADLETYKAPYKNQDGRRRTHG
jgi:hypothetical protein